MSSKWVSFHGILHFIQVVVVFASVWLNLHIFPLSSFCHHKQNVLMHTFDYFIPFHNRIKIFRTEYKLTKRISLLFSFFRLLWGLLLMLTLTRYLNRYYSDRGTCSKCYLSCATCSGPRRDQCVTCPKDWQLASGECHPECPEGFFKSEFGCQKCHHYCKTCSGKFTKMSLRGTLPK